MNISPRNNGEVRFRITNLSTDFPLEIEKMEVSWFDYKAVERPTFELSENRISIQKVEQIKRIDLGSAQIREGAFTPITHNDSTWFIPPAASGHFKILITVPVQVNVETGARDIFSRTRNTELALVVWYTDMKDGVTRFIKNKIYDDYQSRDRYR